MLKGTDLTQSHDGAPLFDGPLAHARRRRARRPGRRQRRRQDDAAAPAGGRRSSERGAVALGAGDRVGYLPQDVLDPRSTIDDLLRQALGEVWEVRLELDALEADLTDLDAYGRAQERFEALGGWALEARLDEALRRLGVEHLDRGARLGSLSGGEAARCLLARRRCSSEPTVLLLDEPTNHLDADGRAWLEEWLAGFAGTLLMVSHDRDFLDATVERIYELSADGLEAYEGGYSDYRERARAAAGAARAARRGAGQAPQAARGRHRDDLAPGAVHRAHGQPRGGAEDEALRQEGGQEGQVARAAAAARDGRDDVGARAARPGGVQGRARRARTRPAADRARCATSPSRASSRTSS